MRTNVLPLFALFATIVPLGLIALMPQSAFGGGFGGGGIAAASAYGALNGLSEKPSVYQQRPVAEAPLRRRHQESHIVATPRHIARPKAAPREVAPLPTTTTDQASVSARTTAPSLPRQVPSVQVEDTVEPAAMGAN
jgi:hypothetical protein